MESGPNRTKYKFDFDRSLRCYKHLKHELRWTSERPCFTAREAYKLSICVPSKTELS
jgi:hypothetical protein